MVVRNHRDRVGVGPEDKRSFLMADTESISNTAAEAAKAAKIEAKRTAAEIEAEAAEIEADSAVRDIEADLRALREDVARLGETVAGIAQARANAIDAAVHRNPWSAVVAGICVGFCLGVRARL
jgi:ElaB/YqjD/DUF883 family membrane-anchored ribosome-binding protein